MALRRFLRSIGVALSSGWAIFTSVVGYEEALIYTALGLIAFGCWQVWQPGSFLVPGAVMLFMYLPARRPFIDREPKALVVRRRKET